jgi:hypothetical protein
MPDELDLDAVMAAAEQAADSGDFAAAERHLQDAARLQEGTLGPAHPDLANTLNNLGVVYERNGRIDEAEASYRRAYAIARETLAPDHPFVATSAGNLREFCETNGRPFELPEEAAAPAAPPMAVVDVEPMGAASPETPAPLSPEPAADDPRPADAGAAAATARAAMTARESPPPAEAPAPRPAAPVAATPRMAEAQARGSRWPMLLLVAIAVVVVFWLFVRSQSGSPEMAPGDATPSESPASESALPAPAPAPPVATPDASAAPSSSAPATPAASAASAPPVVPAPPPPAAAASSAPPVPAPFPTARGDNPSASALTVVRADVCSGFAARGAEWRCDAIGATASPGALVFYTRIRSPRATTIEHRWYRGDTLVQNVRLRIGANPGAGYRTYSRNTVGAGTWRVELRASDGTILREAKFTVR